MGKKGSVILHVLVTGIIIAVIAAGLLRMTMMNYAASARVAQATQTRSTADSALRKAVYYWGVSNTACSSFTDGGETYTCAGASPVNTCNSGCTCTSSVAGRPQIVATASGATCVLTVTTQDNP